MKLTNKLGLPSTIVRAVASDPYAGGGDISVTRLISPPYQQQLKKRHAAGAREDVADRIWALMGQIGHAILERVPTDDTTAVREERLYTPVASWLVSGQFDLIEDGVLTDFKFTSVWSVKDGKTEWEQQLNLLRLLAYYKFKETGDERYFVRKAQIIAVLRDWSKNKVHGDYPKKQVVVVPIKLWTLDEAEEFLAERVEAHLGDDNPPPCSDEERWKKPDEFAVQKPNGKRAIRVYPTREEADQHVAAAPHQKLWVEDRPGSYIRCESYCSVSDVCPVWQQKLAEAPF